MLPNTCTETEKNYTSIKLRKHKQRRYPKTFATNSEKTGSSCSKLTMSLVNVSLKLWSLNMAYTLIFLLKKMWVAFALAKATHIFFSKNTCELDILLTRTVNILTTNELIKLTQLWTSGPWSSCDRPDSLYGNTSSERRTLLDFWKSFSDKQSKFWWFFATKRALRTHGLWPWIWKLISKASVYEPLFGEWTLFQGRQNCFVSLLTRDLKGASHARKKKRKSQNSSSSWNGKKKSINLIISLDKSVFMYIFVNNDSRRGS